MLEPLRSFRQEMMPSIEKEMRIILKSTEKAGDPFFGMMHYHMGWVNENLAAVEHQSGKRIRPLLCLLACRAADGNWRKAVPAAASIELLHNFTLIHDDIQDRSPTRRGRPTAWQIWGANQAINSGDAMFALSHLAMIRMREREVAPEVIVHCLQRLDETCISLTRGQYADMDFEERDEVSVSEYLAMIEGKTAALISFSCEIGAVIAQAQSHLEEHYSGYGHQLGMAFQVRDDILGIWGDETTIGKSAFTDITTRKKSLPVLFGLAESEELRALYASPNLDDTAVALAVKYLDDVGARAFAERYEREYAQNALLYLEQARPEGSAADALYELTNSLLNRQS